LLQAGRDVVIFGCGSLSASVVGRTSIFGLLFVIIYFYIFIHQRLGADIAMNSLPAAIPEHWA
jgi:nicotinamide riboside transporter PnuC